MNSKIYYYSFIITILSVLSCKYEDPLIYSKGDIKIQIEASENWIHKFPLFLGIKKDNAPQFAVWLEDINGKYLSTVYVTEKIATQSWVSSDGNLIAILTFSWKC